MSTKKYVSLSKLSTFLDNLKNVFASKENMNALEAAIDDKVDVSTLTNYYTKDETKEYTDNAVAQKSQVQIITWGVDD